MAANTPQGVGADSSCPFFNPNQLVLMYRNDANCNAILWNYVGVVQWMAMQTVEICNIISWNYVESGTINRPLRLRNERGKIYKWTPTCGVFFAQIYGSEHTARRRGRFIAPVFQSKSIGFNVSKWCELQRHFLELRGCGTMNCNTNGGNTQHHFGGITWNRAR